MILLDLQDVFRIILGAHRVQYLLLSGACSSREASALDFQFRDQLYEDYDYAAFARRMMLSSKGPENIDGNNDKISTRIIPSLPA